MRLLVATFLLFIFTACGQGGLHESNQTTQTTANGVVNRDYSLHGKWLYINSGDAFSIYSNSLLSYEIIDNNLIKVLQDDGSYRYAMRAGTSKAKAVGSVTSLSSSQARSGNRIAGMSVILENLQDPNTRATTITDADGRFETAELPVGEYKISIADVEQNISITQEVEELGNYTIVGKETNNFRLSLQLDSRFVYADNSQYSGKIIIENVSDTTSIGLSYDITIQDTALQHFNKKILLGSILAKGKKEIPISFRFGAISESVKDVPLEVTIRDINGLTWQQSFTIRLYKEKFYINIQSTTANVKGYIILPFSDKVIKIDTSKQSVTLPKIAENYKLLLSNPSLESESVYSIGVQRSAILSTNFNNPSESEPNNRLSEAKRISSGEVVESYMHLGDLDYWVIDTQKDFTSRNTTPYTEIKSNGTYSDNGSFYYLNLSEDSYVDITKSTVKYYDVNLKFLGYINSDTNIFLEAGEYLLRLYTPGRSFTIASFALSQEKNFTQIRSNGTYSDNGSYYYVDFTKDSYVNVTTSSIAYYDMNLKYLGTATSGTNEFFPAGEYLFEAYRAGDDFTIETPYFY